MGALALHAEQGEQFGRLSAGTADPVRRPERQATGPGGRTATVTDNVLLIQ